MSEIGDNNSLHSHSQLIELEFHHVGVTAKLQSPLKKILPQFSSSTDTEIFNNTQSQYNMFENEAQGDTTPTNNTVASSPSQVLYEMHTEPEHHLAKPRRIEFQRYSRVKQTKYNLPSRRRHNGRMPKSRARAVQPKRQELGFFARILASLDKICKCHPQHTGTIIEDLPSPKWNKQASVRHTCIGIYPFEHGCADYLTTTDTHPKINAIVLADRATTYATHFWAEFFGLLHIAVAFVVAFLLQSYRFMLYTTINSLLVGILDMTSDYLLKPVLTVIFNGFLQPPMIFIYNIMCSIRDIFEPIADALNSLMKPFARLGGSFRLVHVNSRHVRRINADV